MNDLKLFDTKRTTLVKSTVFGDGMVVTADDLETAMRYPVDLFRTLVRAYFGCGIVCGLAVKPYPERKAPPAPSGAAEGSGQNESEPKSLCVKLFPGVALDCHGHPLELCEEIVIDLKPDPCACDDPPTPVYVAIGRATLLEAPRDDADDGCEKCGTPRCEHRRQRECVRIKVFPAAELPENLCRRPEALDDLYAQRAEDGDSWEQRVCTCLTACADPCCGDAWVALARLDIDYSDCRIEVSGDVRKFVKPIECLCSRQSSGVVSAQDRSDPKPGA